MKKVIALYVSFLIVLGCTMTAYAVSYEASTDELLAPYRAIIDEVNAEMDAEICIPEANKEKEENKQQLDWNATEENNWFVWKPGSSYIRRLPEE